MKKVILFISLLILNSHIGFAQYYTPDQDGIKPQKAPGEKSYFLNRVYFGGNIAFSFGARTYIDISPLAGYNITDRFTAGLMLTYIYYRYQYYNYYRGVSTYSASVFGASPFTRFFVTENFFLHGELGLYNSPYAMGIDLTSGENVYERRWNVFPMLGGGYIARFGKKAGFTLTALYNFNNKNAGSFYGPIVIRAGFIF